MRLIDKTGQRFGKLVVQSIADYKDTKRRWTCVCDCGNLTVVSGANLSSGNTTSCGCHKASVLGNSTRRHGMSHTNIYYIWQRIIKSCTKPNYEAYKDYGGRGIKVCDHWLVFENFFADVGLPPEGLTIDRINNDGNYEPGNVRWADYVVQANNRRKPKPKGVGKYGCK